LYSLTVLLLLLLYILLKLIDTTLPLLTFVQSDSFIAFSFVYTIKTYWYHTPPLLTFVQSDSFIAFTFVYTIKTYWYHTPPTNICTVGQFYCFYFCIYYLNLLIPHSPLLTFVQSDSFIKWKAIKLSDCTNVRRGECGIKKFK
jgi:hypothetical protein